jgi:hypothetical protein
MIVANIPDHQNSGKESLHCDMGEPWAKQWNEMWKKEYGIRDDCREVRLDVKRAEDVEEKEEGMVRPRRVLEI